MYDVGSDRERDASCCHWHDLDTGGTLRMGSDKHYAEAAPVEPQNRCAEGLLHPGNPRGGRGRMSYDANLRDIKIPRKVIRGGWHLCAPNYCSAFAAW